MQAWLREPLPTFLRSNGVYDAQAALIKLSTAALTPELVVAAHARGYASARVHAEGAAGLCIALMVHMPCCRMAVSCLKRSR